jgi:hypothetical protein
MSSPISAELPIWLPDNRQTAVCPRAAREIILVDVLHKEPPDRVHPSPTHEMFSGHR